MLENYLKRRHLDGEIRSCLKTEKSLINVIAELVEALSFSVTKINQGSCRF